MMPAERRAFQFVWVGLVVASCIYGVIDWIVIRPQIRMNGFEAEIRSPMVLVLYGAAVLTFLGALAISPGRRREKFITRLALFESVAIFGLIAAFVTNDWRLFVPTWALAIIGFLQTLPPSAEYTPGP
jgi:hypothetical protein